jgi:hypothetical protein
LISKPTTEQILNDCSRELMGTVLPAIDDDTVKVAVYMLDLVLRNAAVRAAHEIAWMHEEIDELESYARAVIEAHPRADAITTAVDDLGALAASLHLDDVVERYRRASEAFSLAMETAVGANDEPFVERGAALLEQRVAHETEVMSGWSPVGR